MRLFACTDCLCGNWCICKTLIFSVADALFLTNVSATCFSSNLQMLFSLPVMYNCIYILSFLGFKDTSFANLASTSHVFDNVRMLLSKITHPQPTLSIPCRYSPVKLCICILPFLGFKDTPLANFASTSRIFDNVKMLPSKITHLQPTLSMPCGYSPVKMCILDLRFPWLADTPHQNFASSIP